MTRHIPEGNSLRPLFDVIEDIRNGVDVFPADADEQRIDDFLRRTRARPVARPPVPWIVPFLFGASVALVFVFGAWLASDMIATGAATLIEAERVAKW